MYSDYKLIEDLNINFNEKAPFTMFYEESDNNNEISEKIRKFYLGDKQIDNTTKDELTNVSEVLDQTKFRFLLLDVAFRCLLTLGFL